MELRFMRVGVDIDSLEDADVIKMRAVFQDKSCLVFGITISGETEEVLFLLPSLLHLNHGNAISPQFPMLVMTDICYSHYLMRDQYMKETLHDSTLQALRKGKRDSIM